MPCGGYRARSADDARRPCRAVCRLKPLAAQEVFYHCCWAALDLRGDQLRQLGGVRGESAVLMA